MISGECHLKSFPPFNNELGSGAAKNMFGEDPVNVATVVAMGDVVPRCFLPRLLFAWR